jgi:hypothetical protein
MPNVGDVVTVETHDDTTFALVLEDRVLVDPTYGQWESGWLAYRPKDKGNADAEVFFLSDGDRFLVYGPDDDGHARNCVGWLKT